MRFDRTLVAFSAVLGAAASLAACSKSGTDAILHPNPPLASVRFFNAVGDTLPLDLRPIDQIEFSQSFINVPFRAEGLGNYTGWSTGPRHIRIFPNSSDLATATTIFADTTYSVTAGSYYSFIEIGYARGAPIPKSLWILPDPIPSQGATVGVRVVHVGGDLGPVDVYLTTSATDPLPAAPTFANVGFQSATAYVQVAPGAMVMRVFPAGTTAGALITKTAPAGAPAAAGSGLTNIGGSTQAGSIMTAMIYSKATLGSPASLTGGQTPNTNPTVVFWIDLAPPGTGL